MLKLWKTPVLKYIKILKDYLSLIKGIPEVLLHEQAVKAFDNLVAGMDFDGNEYKFKSNYFDERIEELTEGYYVAQQSTKTRFKLSTRTPRTRSRTKNNDSDTISVEKLLVEEDYDEIEKIKQYLLSAYPALSRKDLNTSVTNYCKLSVLIKKLIDGNAVKDNVALKNMTDTYIKLGTFLGINEGEKSKLKDQEDKQSIASLSVRFQQTLANMPEIVERFRYKEIRILLEKYERQEISRELFSHSSYANMTVEEARDFIEKMEPLYDGTK